MNSYTLQTPKLYRYPCKHIASKVATDLKRLQRLYNYSYGLLSDKWITDFELK